MLCINMSQMPERRFPAAVVCEEQPACFMVCDHNGQALAYGK
jgi:hypothetical protein